MADITSRPFHPDEQKCCQRCAFGTGEHADFCKVKAAEDAKLKVLNNGVAPFRHPEQNFL